MFSLRDGSRTEDDVSDVAKALKALNIGMGRRTLYDAANTRVETWHELKGVAVNAGAPKRHLICMKANLRAGNSSPYLSNRRVAV